MPAIESEVSVSGFLSAHGTDRIVSSTECYNDQESPFPCIKRPDLRTVDFAVMPVGNYKACFRQSMKCVSSECWSEWQSTGIQLTVQDSLTAIDINGEGVIRNPGHGQRVVIPRRTYHTFTYFGSPSQGGKLQMLRRSDECSDFSIDSIGMPLANNFINVAAPDSTVRITGAIFLLFTSGHSIHKPCSRIPNGLFSLDFFFMEKILITASVSDLLTLWRLYYQEHPWTIFSIWALASTKCVSFRREAFSFLEQACQSRFKIILMVLK